MSVRSAISRRLEPLRGDRRTDSAAIGAIVVGLMALALVAGVSGGVPFVGGESGRVVTAEFTGANPANQVNDLTPVRIAGVEVGTVESVDPGKTPASATVRMRIEDDDVVLRRDARAEVRWRTVLGGNMYIDLQPGSPSAPVLGDAGIPASRTASQAELDDVLQVYDRGTDERQRQMLRGLRDGLADPQGVGRSIEVAGPALRTVGRGLEPLRGRQRDDLRGLVRATARTVAGLGRDPAALEQLVTGANRTLAVPAARRRELGELLALAPSSLDSTLVTMRRLDVTLGRLDPVVSRLRVAAPRIAPAADAATPTLARTRTLLRSARPLLRAAGPTLTSLKGAGRNGVPLIDRLDPTVRRLNAQVLPFLERRDGSTKLRNYEAIGPFFSSLATVAAPLNDAGQLLQFAVAPGPGSTLTPGSPAARAMTRAVRRCQTRVPARSRDRCAVAGKLLKGAFGRRR